MDHKYEDPVELLRKYKENITVARTLEKKDFDAWKASLLSCSPAVLEKIPYDVSTWEFETMFSSLYEEWPNPEEYERQYSDAVSKIEEVNTIFNDLNKEAMELIKKANELSRPK